MHLPNLFVELAEKAGFFMGNFTKIPGLCDVHVHFREPGFIYKETIKTGSMAAAHGGFTAVCTMPNLKPVPDSKENLDVELAAIRNSAVIKVYPYASITKNEDGSELSDMDDLQEAIAFSDDGHGVQNADLMKQAMIKAKNMKKIIVAHCEDINEKNPGAAETAEVIRNINLAKETGAALHICHVSKKESIEAVRKAKSEGVDVTCETAPHYLIFTEDDVIDSGRFKMNPPIGNAADRQALVEALKDGTIDMIITDHAPHSSEEKGRGFKESLSGIVGIETSFALMYTFFVKAGIISMEKLLDLMAYNPRKRFNIPLDAEDYALWDLNEEYTIDENEFLSMGKSTPFAGMKVYGRCVMTVCGGNKAYERR